MRGVGRWMMGGPKVLGDAHLQDVVKLRVFATRAEEQGWVALRDGDATGDVVWGISGWSPSRGRKRLWRGGVESRNHQAGA